MRKVMLGALLAVGLLGACSPAPVSSGGAGSPGGAGTATVLCSASTAGVASSALTGARRTGGDAPTRIIVGFRAGTTVTSLSAAGHTLPAQRTLAGGRARVFGLPGGAGLAATLAALRARPEVAYAEPDARVYALATPNDPAYPEQWNLASVAAPGAWAITTGSAGSVIGVVDSGILYDPQRPQCRHPDLAGKVVGGYNFVSDTSAVGGGRSADPYDPDSSNDYHGSHVAGIAAAATDNGAGIAGLDWQAKILPLRVLTADGGNLSDVVDAVEWGSGGAVAGVPANPNPATVLNLSLGADGACPASLQAAIDDATGRGVVVVAAAGNGSERSEVGVDAADTYPADCAGVIAVGATGPSGERAYYSNYGADVALMAPGGEDSGALSAASGITSLSFDPVSQQFGYVQMEGTSMAAPHVAGAVALLRSVNPGLTVAQVRRLLTRTATPLTAQQCSGRGSVGLAAGACGAGLLNVAAAVAAANTP